ncbi:hypothetical protein [Salinarimonas rosea]|uniref:hypothetical protein n=1 Tax=Salinarimonas rosea TaxID=552063 RepID=UPI000400C829|nr:hypothetical protein [Salinarimonas rosea]
MNAAEIFTLGKAGLWLLLPIAFGVWQLVSVRREIRRDREAARRGGGGGGGGGGTPPTS